MYPFALSDFGESSTSLGQFTDEYTDLNYTSVRVDVVRNATYNAMELNYTAGGNIVYENYSTYTEVDANGRYAVTDTTITVESLTNFDRDHYIYYDFGAAYFGDFIHSVDVRARDNSGSAGNDRMYVWLLANLTDDAHDLQVANEEFIGLYFVEFDNSDPDNPNFFLREWVDAVLDQDGFEPAVRGTWYYVKLNKTGTSLTAGVYSTFAGRNAGDSTSGDVTNLAITLDADYKFRYLYAVCSNNDGLASTRIISGDIHNLTIRESGGYETEGYFTTTDYLDEVNGSTLVHLTNATIPASTGITVQFSDDGSTWSDNKGNAGSNAIPDGFYAIDLRELNWSTSYYLRYNFSTTNNLNTPRLYQSRLITTEGPIDLQTQNVSGVFTLYNASSILTIEGTNSGGNTLNNTYWHDCICYNVTEVVGVPGLQVDFNFTGIPDDSICLNLIQCVSYAGVDAHDIHIDVYNFTGSAWVTVEEIPAATCGYINVTLACTGEDYLRDGLMRARYHHPSAGNINDELCIDIIKLQVYAPFDAPAPTITRIIESDFPWIAIAIILMCVAYLLLR